MTKIQIIFLFIIISSQFTIGYKVKTYFVNKEEIVELNKVIEDNNNLQQELSNITEDYNNLKNKNMRKKDEVIKHDTTKDRISNDSINFINGMSDSK